MKQSAARAAKRPVFDHPLQLANAALPSAPEELEGVRTAYTVGCSNASFDHTNAIPGQSTSAAHLGN